MLKPSTPTPTDSQLDELLKSLAKETTTPSGALNVTATDETSGNKDLPNNRCSKQLSGTPMPRPIPPDQLKCNILKARAEEELLATKLTNQVFVAASSPVSSPTPPPSAADDTCHHSVLDDADAQALLCSLSAATFVSVVSFVILVFFCFNCRCIAFVLLQH